MLMADLRTPIVACVIGEGGSGGALALGVADRLLMLEYATYSVISPEGCASILWKDSNRAAEAADTMGITSARLHSEGLIDAIVEEPLGGAHRDVEDAAARLKDALVQSLDAVRAQPLDELVEKRYQRLLRCGKFEVQ